MANTKTYKIVINGVQESIRAVDSLNKQLNDLEQRINTLNSKGVNINTPKGGGVNYTSELDAQEKLEKQILATEQKLEQVRDDNYKKLLHMKEELREYSQIAKSQVAREANQQGLFDPNTMFGLKAQLKNIKTEMQTIDISSERFRELTLQANELNNKLKEIEQSYGQYGRNVGNYANGVAEGMSKLKIEVNGVTKEFDSAKQAMKSLGNEMKTLSTKKDMGIITKEEEERLRGLIPVVNQLKSSIADAGKPMDNLMDTMQGFASIASIGQGLSALFGVSNEEIQKSIEKLLAIQAILQGIQTLQLQIQTQQGVIGKSLGTVLSWIDKAEKSTLLWAGAVTKVNGQLVVTKQGFASFVRGFTSVIKTIATALGGVAIFLLIDELGKLVDRVLNGTDAMKALKKATEDGVGAFAKASIEMQLLKQRLDDFNGSQKEEKKLVEELNSQYGTTIGQYKSVAAWKDALAKKTDAYCKMLQKEAEMQAYVNRITELYIHLHDLQAKQQSAWWRFLYQGWFGGKGIQGKIDETNDEIEDLTKRAVGLQKELDKIQKENKIGGFAPQIDKNSTKSSAKQAADWVKEYNELVIANMKEGLEKQIAQLNEERRQKLQKIKKDGVMVGKLSELTNALYDKKILKAKEDWANRVLETYTEMYNKIADIVHENAELEYDTQINNIKTKYDQLAQEAKSILGDTYSPFLPKDKNSLAEYTKILQGEFDKRLDAQRQYYSDVEKLEVERLNAQLKIEKDKINEGVDNELRTLKNSYALEDNELKEHVYNGLITQDDYNKTILRLQEERTNKEALIIEKAHSEIRKLEQENEQEILKIRSDSYKSQLDEYEKYLNRLGNLDTSNPIANSFGFVNVRATAKRNNEIKKMYAELYQDILKEKEKLENNKASLDPIDYEEQKQRLNDWTEYVYGKMQEVDVNMRKAVDASIQKAMDIVQLGLQSISQIMNAIWDYQDSIYEHQMDALEKQIDKYEELLQKQEDITRQHQENVDDIEDELATSRGDRRQHLIDQLNEEIAAQRRSMIEQKRIEREEEKLKKKKEREEEAQRKREHQRQVQQAFISWHLSIANGLATQPFMPVGLAMGALATALGAVQYALVKSQKYADGGVIQGKSHAQGGVKVLGGRAEVEGGEFITNKRTTAQNLDLLEYINSKRKKVDINDLIEFYNGGKIRKNISNVRTKFADGGVVPSLRTDIDINDRLLTAIESYAERDVVVSVVDINKRQQAVKNVQVLAGLND